MLEYSELSIPGVRLWLFVGCSAEERAIAQPIDIGINIRFFHDLPGSISDQLKDVVCYHTLVEKLTKVIESKSFHLLECLTTHIFSILAGYLLATHIDGCLIDALVEVSVTKLRHPIPPVQQGITFRYARRVSQKSS